MGWDQLHLRSAPLRAPPVSGDPKISPVPPGWGLEEGTAPCPWCPGSYPARRDMVLSPGHIQRSEPLPTTASVIAGGPVDTGSEFGSEPGAI